MLDGANILEMYSGSEVCTLQKAFTLAIQKAYLEAAASLESGREQGFCDLV